MIFQTTLRGHERRAVFRGAGAAAEDAGLGHAHTVGHPHDSRRFAVLHHGLVPARRLSRFHQARPVHHHDRRHAGAGRDERHGGHPGVRHAASAAGGKMKA